MCCTSHLVEEVTNPLGHHQDNHDRKTERDVARRFDHNDRQTDGHPDNPTCTYSIHESHCRSKHSTTTYVYCNSGVQWCVFSHSSQETQQGVRHFQNVHSLPN